MKKTITIFLILTLIAALLTGCGAQAANTAANGTKSAKAPEGSAAVTTIKVGTAGSPKPYIFTDDDNNVIGFDADVVAAIDELLPQYEFVYELTDFKSVFTGVDAGIYQMGDNNITRKPEREEKYLFGNEYYGYNITGLIVRADDDSIQSLEDLVGKKTYTSGSGLFSQVFLERYNETHADNPVELIYSNADSRKQYQDLQDGLIDFEFTEYVIWAAYLDEFPEYADTLKFVYLSDEETKSVQDPLSWFIFQKNADGEALAAAVDGALRTLKENGKLNELGQKWLGYDVVR